MAERQIPQRFRKKLRSWYASFAIWRFLHYGVGITGIVCSSMVAATKAGDLGFPVTKLAVTSAIAAALLTFLSPKENASAYIRAWRILDAAAGSYELKGSATEDELLAAERTGESIIQKTDI